MTCAICWDTMDMREFQDPQESTATCFKIECGHAFHTRCLVSCLTSGRHKCPLCNSDKPPEQELEHTGYARKMLQEILNCRDVTEVRKELNEAERELKEVGKAFKKKLQEFGEELAKEMKLSTHREYYAKCLNTTRGLIRTKCREVGNRHLGAYYFRTSNYEVPLVDRLLTHEKRYWRYWRRVHCTRFCVSIKISKKRNESSDSDSDGSDGDNIRSQLQLDNDLV